MSSIADCSVRGASQPCGAPSSTLGPSGHSRRSARVPCICAATGMILGDATPPARRTHSHRTPHCPRFASQKMPLRTNRVLRNPATHTATDTPTRAANMKAGNENAPPALQKPSHHGIMAVRRCGLSYRHGCKVAASAAARGGSGRSITPAGRAAAPPAGGHAASPVRRRGPGAGGVLCLAGVAWQQGPPGCCELSADRRGVPLRPLQACEIGGGIGLMGGQGADAEQ